MSAEQLSKEWCTLHLLIQELSVAQGRLGTAAEKKDDSEVVRDLGHRIRNKLHLVQLWDELGLIDTDHISQSRRAS